jgi:hypothetical protein
MVAFSNAVHDRGPHPFSSSLTQYCQVRFIFGPLPRLTHGGLPVRILFIGHYTPHLMTHENETADLPEGVGSTAISSACLNIVEQYCVDRTSKGDAVYELTKAIPSGETQAEESPGKTFESYLSMLDNWDYECIFSDSNERRNMERDGYSPEDNDEWPERTREVARDGDGDEYDEPDHK